MKISVICPTRNRHHLLPQLVRIFQAQTWPDKELLILDDSPAPSPLSAPGVRYFHSTAELSIGAKRNRLIEQASGDVIAHFDDDDYYAPHYLEFMAGQLAEFDFVKLDGWYVLGTQSDFFGYWDTRTITDVHYPIAPWKVAWDEAKRASLEAGSEGDRWGYGFSYVYRREIGAAVGFPDRNFGEDYAFVQRLQAIGTLRLDSLPDKKALCVHLIHAGNTSGCTPQHRLPMAQLKQLFPEMPNHAPQLICLSMIVKNESAVIERCLRSVKPYIQSWAIADTGSSDGTQDIVRRVMADLPGELIERPWVDFASNRNQALELARRHGDYALIIDADEVLEADPGFAWGTLDAPGYLIELVYGGTHYRRVALPRLDLDWTWRGVLHEALVSQRAARTQILPGLRIRVFTDGARSQQSDEQKFSHDAEVLRAALHNEPDNARYAFYLAQSLRDAGRLPESISAYEQSVAMGGWPEEVYFSKFQIGVLKERAGAAYAEVVAAYVDAYDFRPTRAEAPCELARYLRLQKRYAAAREFARIAAALPVPDDLLFIERAVYEWRARDEWSISAYWSGAYADSARLCRELLTDPNLPEAQRERVQRNLEFAQSKLQ